MFPIAQSICRNHSSCRHGFCPFATLLLDLDRNWTKHGHLRWNVWTCFWISILLSDGHKIPTVQIWGDQMQFLPTFVQQVWIISIVFVNSRKYVSALFRWLIRTSGCCGSDHHTDLFSVKVLLTKHKGSLCPTLARYSFCFGTSTSTGSVRWHIGQSSCFTEHQTFNSLCKQSALLKLIHSKITNQAKFSPCNILILSDFKGYIARFGLSLTSQSELITPVSSIEWQKFCWDSER